MARHPDEIKKYLQEDEYKVYKLIWQRFVASQMMPAVFDQTSVDIEAKNGAESFTFRVTGSILKFEGFLKVYEESKDAKDEEDEELKHKLPALEAGQKLTLRELKPEQHFTEPPPRFNEASLVKELEERGIGRPSTYSTIISTIVERQYVQKIGGKFIPTETGLVVTDLLVKNFEEIFDPAYTARLEEELDEIEEGKEKWTDALGSFYKKFEKDLRYAEKHMENVKRMEKPTDEKCERCGSPLVLKWGKHGSFYACSSYKKDDPESCTFTKENPVNLPDFDGAEMPETGQDEYCENCGRVMVLKRGRFGQFMACTGYPDCKTTRRLDQGKRVPDVPLEELCPKCSRNLVLRHGRYGEFISCSGYPDCKYIKQNFIGVKCPQCADGELVEKILNPPPPSRSAPFFKCHFEHPPINRFRVKKIPETKLIFFHRPTTRQRQFRGPQRSLIHAVLCCKMDCGRPRNWNTNYLIKAASVGSPFHFKPRVIDPSSASDVPDVDRHLDASGPSLCSSHRTICVAATVRFGR